MAFQIPEGWTAHDGKSQPVRDHEAVQIICRGDVGKEPVDRWEPAGTWHWLHSGSPKDSDIVFYKTEN